MNDPTVVAIFSSQLIQGHVRITQPLCDLHASSPSLSAGVLTFSLPVAVARWQAETFRRKV